MYDLWTQDGMVVCFTENKLSTVGHSKCGWGGLVIGVDLWCNELVSNYV